MKCMHCTQQAIWLAPSLCKEHYIEDFEARVENTIQEYNLIPKGVKICVAASGGKDSLTTLYLLKKFGFDITALVIDEGIEDYREHTIVDLQAFCSKHDIPLRIASFSEHAGQPLDSILSKGKFHACTVCGIFRRYLLNKHANGFDLLATGHNADDEAQVVLMNLLRAQTPLLSRGGPKTGQETAAFVQRIKPLYFCTEKEVTTYAIVQGFQTGFTECPNVTTSYRAKVRDVLNAYAQKYPGVQRRILSHYLKEKDSFPKEKAAMNSCQECGAPSMQEVCSNCITLQKVTRS